MKEEIRQALRLSDDRIYAVIDTLRFLSDKTSDGIDTRCERQTLMSLIDTMKEKYNSWDINQQK